MMHSRAFWAATETPLTLNYFAPQKCDEVSRAVDESNNFNSR